MKKLYNLTVTAIFLFMVSCSTGPEVTSIDPKSKEIISSLEDDIGARKEKAQHHLSPGKYEEVNAHLEEAKERAQTGEPYEKVEEQISKARSYFSAMDKNYQTGKFHLANVLDARDQAIEEGASTLDEFKDAEDELNDAGYDIEDSDINDVLANRDELKQLYTEAEVIAIQNRELATARKLRSQALARSVVDEFDSMVERTGRMIKTAEKMISQNKDSEDRYRESVTDATNAADILHARVETAQWIEDTPVKDITLSVEDDLESIASQMGVKSLMKKPYNSKITYLKTEAAFVPVLRAELSDERVRALRKQEKLVALKSEKRNLASQVERQNELSRTLRSVRGMFSEDEAEILLKGDDLIVRLTGVGFPVNQTAVPQKSYPLIEKVAKAIEKFDNAEVEIHGHTDITGDALYNQKLSQKRAQSVKRFLQDKTSVKAQDFQTKGYGFSQPIAENKTAMGRIKNRRIDVVIESVVN